jgi:TnpA family transposase
MMKNKKSERLTVLSELEEFAFYGFPDFDHEQRLTYFQFNDQEWESISKCPSLHIQVYCALQIGYFKAKNLFFNFSLEKIPQEDVLYILSQHFDNQTLDLFTVTKHERYLQQAEISRLFGYKTWSTQFLEVLTHQARQCVKIDIAPNFIAKELLGFLQNKKIIRPGYTTLQTIVSSALIEERQRLKLCLQSHLTESDKQALQQLLVGENTLSELASLKQDAANFSFAIMQTERKKHATLKPLYDIAKRVLPNLSISQQNIDHYASLVHFYTLRDLKRFEKEQTHLYLLCYVIKRYRLINDNLADAFHFHVKKLEKEAQISAKEQEHDDLNKKVGQLILLYADDDISPRITWGRMIKRAFQILPKETIRVVGEKLVKKPHRQQSRLWEARDKIASRYRKHLRPLLTCIDFDSQLPDNSLLEAIHWTKDMLTKKKLFSKTSPDKFPKGFISKRVNPYIFSLDEEGKQIIKANRFEILLYRQIVKQMTTGALYIEESTSHRTFFHELVSPERQEEILKTLIIPWVKTPCKKQLDSLFKELDTLLIEFDNSLKQGKLKHLKYDFEKKAILWVKPRFPKEENPKKETFYDKLPIAEIADVVRFVHEKTGFLSAFALLQSRYSKQKLDVDFLTGLLISQGTGTGNHRMAQTSDIPYEKLESGYSQYLRHLSNFKKALFILGNNTSQLSIAPYCADDLEFYASVDGQKYEAVTPTAKARNSKKYFKKGKGVVAYTLFYSSLHFPMDSIIIGPHDPENYFLFDIWYGNTSLFNPTIITGDMHSVNKANFGIPHWFGGELRPRFTNLKKELDNIFCGKDPAVYKDFLSPPKGQINEQIILDEKSNIDRIVASLASKEISQSTLIRKLCQLPPENKTRQAVFEYNKLIRSIYTLKCILDPKILMDSHRSQNRLESYHALRAHIAKAGGGKKALLGRTDIEVVISNLCGVLLAAVVINYNGHINSHIIDTNPEKIRKAKKSSLVAHQHIHFTGHFTFYKNKRKINLKKITEDIDF